VKHRLSTWSKCAVVFSAFVALGAVEARADVKLEETYSTYQLRGLSREAIHEDLHRVAKRDRDGLIDGEMSNDLHWNFRFAAAENSCRVSSDEIVLKIYILLPRWVDEERANSVLHSIWNTYFQELKAHEDGHKTIAVAAAERISKLAHDATASGSCTALERSLNDAAKRIVEDSERAQNQHDLNSQPFDL
jgi:predicted secreted Zn-dependent protease